MAHLITPLADRLKDGVALVDEHGTRTWQELDDRVNQLIHIIRSLGVERHGTIAIIAANSREYIELSIAGAHTSVHTALINTHWVADEIAYVLENSGAQILFTDDLYLEVAEQALALSESRPHLVTFGEVATQTSLSLTELLGNASTEEPDDQGIGAPMFYTSGTTGHPKGVRSTQIPVGEDLVLMELLVAGFKNLLGMPADGASLLCGPGYHSAQWATSVLPLMWGSTTVTLRGFDAAQVLTLIDRHEVTNVHLVPTQFMCLLKLDEQTKGNYDGSSMKVVLHGAAPCSADTKRSMIEWWGAAITEYYGGTESGFLTMISGDEWLKKPGSVGKPVTTAEVLIVGDQDELLDPGNSGQIYFRNLMGSDFSYHNDPKKTAQAHRPDGTATLGDIGFIDEDGYLFLTDRKIDMIISGGVNIYPAEIEEAILKHPAVADVAVFGIPHEEMGESVMAAIQTEEGIEETDELKDEIESHCRKFLAGYKTPRTIKFYESLPRLDTGKLLKRVLRDPYWEGHSRQI